MDNRELDLAIPESRRTRLQVDGDGQDAEEEDESEVPRDTLEYVTYTLCSINNI